MYFVITFENGVERHGEFNSYCEALDYAEINNGGYDFTIDQYDSEEDYENID